MNSIEDKLKELIISAVNKTDNSIVLKKEDVVIEKPKNKENGDYSTNIAMKLAKQLKDNPLNNATKIVANIEENNEIENIEIVKPGFINFFMNNKTLGEVITKVLAAQEDYGQWPLKADELINVEYVSANPTGDLHLGHARQASLGDSISRLYKKAGYNITREYYVNDAGNQINNLAYSVIARYHQLFDIDYPLPEDGYHGKDIIDIAQMIKTLNQDQYLNDDSEEAFLYFKKTALQFELDKLKNDLQEFRVEFDTWTSEQKLYDDGKVIKSLNLLEEKGVTYEQDGAIWLKSTLVGDDKDRVLKKSDGTYTYLAPDIANHLQKLENGADYMVDIWGADHHGYIKRMAAAIELLTGSSKMFDVDIVQMVRLISGGQEVKMSKRTGNAIGLRELCEETSVDAVRYFFASRSGNSHFDFDLDLATSQSNENPVYYAQYAHARICSILAIAKDLNLDDDYDASLLVHEKELALMKHLNDFIPLIRDAAQARAPHKVCLYIQKLASLFHSYYNDCKVIDQQNLPLTKARLKLLEAVKITQANALDVIGVSAPNKM